MHVGCLCVMVAVVVLVSVMVTAYAMLGKPVNPSISADRMSGVPIVGGDILSASVGRLVGSSLSGCDRSIAISPVCLPGDVTLTLLRFQGSGGPVGTPCRSSMSAVAVLMTKLQESLSRFNPGPGRRVASVPTSPTVQGPDVDT